MTWTWNEQWTLGGAQIEEDLHELDTKLYSHSLLAKIHSSFANTSPSYTFKFLARISPLDSPHNVATGTKPIVPPTKPPVSRSHRTKHLAALSSTCLYPMLRHHYQVIPPSIFINLLHETTRAHLTHNTYHVPNTFIPKSLLYLDIHQTCTSHLHHPHSFSQHTSQITTSHPSKMDTPTLDFLINNPPTPTTPSTHPSALSTLLQNWPSTPSLLPCHIPHDLTPALLSSLAALSHLTRNDPERAWRLVETYYTCRLRSRLREEVSVSVSVSDVEKAAESARRMSVGRGMERAWNRDEGKRKTSIRDQGTQQGLAGGELVSKRGHGELTCARRLLAPVKSKALSIAVPSREARAATHAASLARVELEAAEECLNGARARYADAQRSYGEAKRMAKRARLGM